VEAASDTRKKVWEEWKTYCQAFGVNPHLDGESVKTIARISTGFGGRLRREQWDRPIGTGSFCTNLGGINTLIAMDMDEQPIQQQDWGIP